MSRPTTLLITGLTMEFSKSINPKMDTVKFGRALEDSMNTLNEVPNLHQERFDLDPTAPPEAANSTDSLEKLVRQGPPQGGPWDAHLIGLGVRMLPPLTTLFESIVNTTASVSGGRTKLLFSETGADHWEVVKRGCTELELGEKPES